MGIRSFLLVLLAVLAADNLPALSDSKPNVLIVYHSVDGHTKLMAEAVARGAESVTGVEVDLLSVQQATPENAISADAVILGSPVYNANVTPELQRFINSWPFRGAPMRDKIGAAFVSGGGISAGEEVVQLNILKSMLIFGMVVVGGPEWVQAFGASAITEEAPFQQSETGTAVDAKFLDKGEKLGRRIAEWALRLSKINSGR